MKKLWTLILALLLITGLGLSDWKYNPFTGKLDYYEPVSGGALNDLSDVNAGAPANNEVLTWNNATSRWIAQAQAGGGDMATAVYDIGVDGDIDAAAGGTNIDSSGFTDYVYVTAGVWAVDPTLGHNAAGLDITANADTANIILDGTNLNIKWSDGNFIAQSDEGVNPEAIFQVVGKGTGAGQIYAYDTDNDTYVGFSWPGGDDVPNLSANANLHIQWGANNSVDFFTGALSGENPSVAVHGFVTAGAAVRTGYFQVDDGNDEFLIGAENNANLEGITLDLPEANQAFRIRGNGGLAFVVDNSGTVTTGTWNGTAIDLSTYTNLAVDANELTLTGDSLGLADHNTARTALGLAIGTDVLAQQTIGIADNNLIEIDGADIADDEFARFTANGLESRTGAEVMADLPAAGAATSGRVELATTAETSAGTDATRSVTPDGLAESTIGRKTMVWKLTATDGIVVSGDDLDSILVPADFAGWNVASVAARIITADDGADDIDIDIYNVTQTADILSTEMTIEGGEFSTLTSATPGTIDGGEDDITGGDIIRIDITAYAGDNAAGLEVHITFEKVV